MSNRRGSKLLMAEVNVFMISRFEFFGAGNEKWSVRYLEVEFDLDALKWQLTECLAHKLNDSTW